MNKKRIIKKVCLVGDTLSGKKTLLSKIAPFLPFLDKFTEVIGTSITKYVFECTYKGQLVDLLIVVWDVTGKIERKSLFESYCKGAEGVIIVVDASKRKSIESIPLWKEAVFKVTGDIPYIILLNKIDLISVREKEGVERSVYKMVNERERVFLVSGLTMSSTHLREPFQELTESIMEYHVGRWG